MLSASHVESQRHAENVRSYTYICKKKSTENVAKWKCGGEILFLYIHRILNILPNHTFPLYVIGPGRKVALRFYNLLTCNAKR
jgi:hypothetical protein